jgi:hypothetical protein
MVSASDLIRLPYTPDLSEGGIAYAYRGLACTYPRLGMRPMERMRRSVASVAVELAFRRYLDEQKVPYKILDATPFTDPNHHDISLGGHRCDLTSYFISRRTQISSLRRNPSLLLQAPALAALDPFAAEGNKPDDICLFAFLLGLTAASQEDTRKAAEAGQPVHLLYLLPEEWRRPATWNPFAGVALKSECEEPITVEIGGQNGEREFTSATIELPPKKRVLLEETFYSAAYLHARRKPEARIGIHCPAHGEPILIQLHDWGNIQVYGMDIWLAGWLSREEYRRKAYVLNVGQSTFQFAHTHTKNLAVPLTELNPLGPLFHRVRDWEAVKTYTNSGH